LLEGTGRLECAERLGVSPATFDVVLHRATRSFARALEAGMRCELELDGAPVAAAEAEQAARLAPPSDGSPAPGVDRDALAVAFLLQTVAEARAGDEVAAARFRRLERDRRAAGRRRGLLRFAAGRPRAHRGAARGSRCATTAVARPPRGAGAPRPDRRWRACSRSKQPVAGGRTRLVASRQGELLAAIQAERFETLRRTLLERLLDTTTADGTQPQPTYPEVRRHEAHDLARHLAARGRALCASSRPRRARTTSSTRRCSAPSS